MKYGIFIINYNKPHKFSCFKYETFEIKTMSQQYIRTMDKSTGFFVHVSQTINRISLSHNMETLFEYDADMILICCNYLGYVRRLDQKTLHDI